MLPHNKAVIGITVLTTGRTVNTTTTIAHRIGITVNTTGRTANTTTTAKIASMTIKAIGRAIKCNHHLEQLITLTKMVTELGIRQND